MKDHKNDVYDFFFRTLYYIILNHSTFTDPFYIDNLGLLNHISQIPFRLEGMLTND